MSETRSSEGAKPASSAPESVVDASAVDAAGPAVDETTGSQQNSLARGQKPNWWAGMSKLAALRRPRVAVSVLVVVALLATTGFLGLRLHRETTARENRDEALSACRSYALALTSYDFHDLNGNSAAVARNSSPRFAQQYKQVSDSLTKLIQQYQATSKGTVVDRGIAHVDANRAVLTLFVDQAITNTNNPQPRVDRNRMRMTLVRSGDRWLLDDVQLV